MPGLRCAESRLFCVDLSLRFQEADQPYQLSVLDSQFYSNEIGLVNLLERSYAAGAFIHRTQFHVATSVLQIECCGLVLHLHLIRLFQIKRDAQLGVFFGPGSALYFAGQMVSSFIARGSLFRNNQCAANRAIGALAILQVGAFAQLLCVLYLLSVAFRAVATRNCVLMQ